MIEWDFEVESGYTVDFSVAYKTPIDKKKKKNSEGEAGVATKKEKKYTKVVVEEVARIHQGEGRFKAPGAGCVVLYFDNGFSMFRSKAIHFSVAS